MWPFKKQKPAPATDPAKAQSIICIPGRWADRDEFVLAIIDSSKGDYVVAGGILFNAKEDRHYTIEFCERDERMRASFAAAGRVTRVTDEFLDEIDKHKYVVYISGETGGLAASENIAKAGTAVLKAGGIGVKIESAGKAFSKDHWLALMDGIDRVSHYEMFVIDSITNEDGTVFSCGMHNLGLRDTIVSDEDVPDAVELIRIFGYYQIVDKPVIEENQTFRKNLESPRFRITTERHPPYAEAGPFYNPYGMWRLTRDSV
jgi:hypothetical protein